MTTLRERSKLEFEVKQFTFEEIQTGCLQRIADATEKMAQNYTQLLNEREMYKRWYNEASEKNAKLWKRIYALRGVITRMKKVTTHK